MTKTFQVIILQTSTLFHVIAQKSNSIPIPDMNDIFQPMKWRSIGPFRGGRSVCASGVKGDMSTYYMGTTGGGIWKTNDLGNNWTNISDGFFKSGSVGAIAVSESQPNIVYVGMGEHAVRGVMTHHGDGVYKSMDAGKTWKKIGLDLSQHISRIVVHPTNPNIVFVAVQGALYTKSQDRGIYRSTDGGENWSKVLYVNENTGCSELSLDMNFPHILYAAMWEHGRLPWKVISGGVGSGLYKSVDGGTTWEKINHGLPAELGKMSISVCRSNNERVYALVESDSDRELGGLFVSNDAGLQWTRVTNDHRLIQRAWYYIELFTDPHNDNILYVLSASAYRSIDGGNTWEEIEGQHGDYHDLWINPDNPKNMIISDDGGACVSVNYGKTWSSLSSLPTAQIYRINADHSFPYKIYSGQQDYSSVVIANRNISGSGIGRENWKSSAGGESAFLAFNPDDPRYVMGGSYLGTIDLLDTKADASTNIMAAPIQYLGRETKEMKYRFNWNAPIIWSKHEPNTFYHGAQHLLKTIDMGQSWKEISPDLTRNEKEKQGKGGGPYTNEAVGAENYGTLSYVVESPLEKGVIWTGSDDGLLHITRDGGATWQNVTPAGLKECLINSIEVSLHDPATAYIATTRYKFSDYTPGLYKTTNYGKTWINISNGIPTGSFTRVVREDKLRKNLLFAGTESGAYISFDGGSHWSKFQLNLPITPITDIKIHQNNLIAGTSGRGIWILDDLSLIRQYVADTTSLMIYTPSPTVLVNGSSELDKNPSDFKGSHPTRGVNPASGAVVYYYLPVVSDSTNIELQIRDEQGAVVRTFTSIPDTTFHKWEGGPSSEPILPKSKGLNRFVWNLRHSTMTGVPGVYIESSFKGHKVSPGTYTISLKNGDKTGNTMVEILPNPLYTTTKETYQEYTRMMGKMEGEVTLMHQYVNTIYNKRRQLEQIVGQLPMTPTYAPIIKNGKTLIQEMQKWDEKMVQRKSKAYDDVENFPNKFTANYLFMVNHAESDLPRINQSTIDRYIELNQEWKLLEEDAVEILKQKIPAYNQLLWDNGIGPIWKE